MFAPSDILSPGRLHFLTLSKLRTKYSNTWNSWETLQSNHHKIKTMKDFFFFLKIVKIELHHFSLSLPPPVPPRYPYSNFPMPPTLTIMASFPFIFVVTHTYICVYAQMQRYNLLSTFLLFGCIWFQGWPQGSHLWNSLILHP